MITLKGDINMEMTNFSLIYPSIESKNLHLAGKLTPDIDMYTLKATPTVRISSETAVMVNAFILNFWDFFM